MEYNKRQFAKANDKKVLHKVKKHWVVMSMALLMAIGGEAAMTHVSAHAENNNSNPQTNNANTIKERLNQSLIQARKAQPTQNQNQLSQGQTAQKQIVNPQQSTVNGRVNQQANLNSITKQADVLHQRIVQNADLNSSRQIHYAQSNDIINNQMLGNKLNNGISSKNNHISETQLVNYHNETLGDTLPNLNKNISPMNPWTQQYIPTDPRQHNGGIQMTGTWGSAHCILFNDNLLYVQGPGTIGSAGADETNAGLSNPDLAHKAVSIVFSDVTAPSDMTYEFVGANTEGDDNIGWNNLLYFDGRGLDVSNTKTFAQIFDWYGGPNTDFTDNITNSNGTFANIGGSPVRGLRYIDLSTWNVSSTASSAGDGFNVDDGFIVSIKTGPNGGNIGNLLWGPGSTRGYPNGPLWPTNWIRKSTHTYKYDMETEPLPSDTYYYTGTSASDVTINWYYGKPGNRHNILIDTNYEPRHMFSGDMKAPSGYVINSDNPSSWNVSSDDTIDVYCDKQVPVNFWFGKQNVNQYTPSGNGIANVSSDGVHTVSAAQFSDMPSGYGVDPRQGNSVEINSAGGNNIQVDKTGYWGNAAWDLTPGSDIPDDGSYGKSVTKKYGKNSLYVHDGPLNGPIANVSSLSSVLPIITHVDFNNVIAPSSCNNLLNGLSNVQGVSLNYFNVPGQGLNTNDVNDMSYMFHANDSHTLQKIDHLSDLSTGNVNNMEGMFENTAINNSDLNGNSANNTTGVSKWNVNRVSNLKDMLYSSDQSKSNLSDWSAIMNNWEFYNSPSDNGMLSGSKINEREVNDNQPKIYKHKSGMYMFTPAVRPNKFTYYDWFTGDTVGDEGTCDISPGQTLHADATEINHPANYSVADKGDDGAPNVTNLVAGSDNYVPTTKVGMMSDGQYGVPVVSNDVADYGYDGTAKYELLNNGTLIFTGGIEYDNATHQEINHGEPLLNAGSIGSLLNKPGEAAKVKHIEFENVQAPADSSNLFSNLPSVQDIDLNTLITYGTNNMSNMFNANNNHTLSQIDHLSDLDTSDVIDMSGMFKNAGIYSLQGASDWNVYGVQNLDSDFSDDVNLANWNDVYYHWAFNTPPSTNRMLSNDRNVNVASGVNVNAPATYKRHDTFYPAINNKYMFVPDEISHEIDYYNWQTGNWDWTNNKLGSNPNVVNNGKLGGQEIGNLSPDSSNNSKLRSDDTNAHQVPTLPKYKLADDGDNGDPFMPEHSSDYMPYQSVSENSDDIYMVPAVKSDVTNYGFDGTSKYTLDSDGNMFFYGGTLSSKPLNKLLHRNQNEIKSIRNITFERVAAPSNNVMTGLFSKLPSLKDIDFAGLSHTSDVTNMGSLMASDPSLSDAEISDLKTNNVSDMSSMFQKDSALTNLDVSHVNTQKMSDMSNMFSGDSKLSDLDLTSFDTTTALSKPQHVANAFAGDSKLSRLSLGRNTVFTSDVGLDLAWLSDASAGGDINYNGMQNLENDEHHPGNWNAITDKSGVSGVWGTAAWALVDNGDFYLVNGDLYTNKWLDPDHLKKYSRTGVKLANKTDVKRLHTYNVTAPQDSSQLFSGLSKMSQFNGFGLNVDNVTKMDDMFANDASIHDLDLSNFDPSNLSSMNGMFANDGNLTHLNVSQLRFSNNNGRSFNGDNNLLELKLNNQLKLTDPNNAADAKFFAHNVDANDYITTNQIANGIQDTGTYFAATPVSIHFVNQNEVSDEPSSLNGKYVYVPTDSDSYQFGYHGNIHDQLAALGLTHETDPDDKADPQHTILPFVQQDYEIHNSLDNNPYVDIKVSGNAEMNTNNNKVKIVYENSDEKPEVGPNEPNPQTVNITLSGNDSDYIDYDPHNLVPKGYQLDTDNTINSDFQAQITSGNTFNWVHPDLSNGIPTVYVKGDHETADATVHQIIETPAGRVINSDYRTVSDQASVGQKYILHNSDSDSSLNFPDANVPMPKDCVLAGTDDYNVPDASKNHNLSGIMLLNDSGQPYLEHPDETVYYVDTNTHSQITVDYINQQGDEVGHFPVTQADDSTLDLTNNSNFIKNHTVPGYSYDTSKNIRYKIAPFKFDGNTQNAYVRVIGQKETLDIKYKTYKKGNLVSEKKIENDDTRVGNRLSDALSGILPKNYVITDKTPDGHDQVTNYKIPYVSGDNPIAGPYTLYVTGQIKTVPVQFIDQNGNDPLGQGILDDSAKGKIYSDITLPNAPEYYHYSDGQSNKDTLKLSDVDTSNNPNGTNPNSDNYMKTVPVHVQGDKAQVHVKYVDQNNNQVGSDMITTNDSGQSAEMGDTVTCYPNGKSANGSAPAGYTINNASDQNYVFKPSNVATSGDTLNMKDYIIHVHGNHEQLQPQINVVYENGDKNHTPQSSRLVTLHVNSDDGDKYVFYPNEMVNSNDDPNVPAGYSIDTSAGKTPKSYTADLNANQLTWENPSTHQQQSGYRPTVYFVATQSNQLPNVSDTIHITQIELDPNDGHVIGTNKTSDTLSDYTHGNEYVGDSYQIAENSIKTPNNWQLAEGTEPNAALNQDSAHQYNIDGNVDADGITNNHVTLYYVAKTDSKPLTIHYKIMGHSSDITSHTYNNGYYGQQINGFDQFNDSPLDKYKLDVQNTPADHEFTFGVNDDNLIAPNQNIVYVLPADVDNNSVNVHIDLEDKNGNSISGKSDITVPVAVYPNSKGGFTISSDNDVLRAYTQGFLPNHNDEGFAANNVNSDIAGDLESGGPTLTKNKTAKFFYHADPNQAGSITVKYRNQNGRYVTLNGSDIEDYQPYPDYKIYNHAGKSDYYYGQTLSDVVKLIGLPKGYHLPENYNKENYNKGLLKYTFNGNNQTAVINVQGNAANKLPVTIKVIRKDPHMNFQQPIPYYTINGTVSGHVGDSFDFSPQNYAPNGYASLSEMASLKINWDAAHSKPILSNDGALTFTYLDEPSDANVSDLKPINVNYVNAQTHQVVKQGKIQSSNLPEAYEGIVIPNVTQYVSMPKGYSVYDNTFNPYTNENTQAIMNDKSSAMSLLVQPTDSTGHNPGNKDNYDSDGASDNAEPIYITYRYAGKVIGAKDRRVDGKLGQTVDIMDQPDCAVPNGYHVVFGQNLDYKIGTESFSHIIRLQPNRCSDATYQVTVRLVSPTHKLIRSDRVPYQVKLSGSKEINVNDPSDPNINVGNLISNHDFSFDSTYSTIFASTRIYNNGGTVTDSNGDAMGPAVLTYIAKPDPDNLGKITVHYIDDATGQELSQTKTGTYVIGRGHGHYDAQKFSVSDIAKDTTDGVAVPDGYSTDANQNQSYTLGVGNNTVANIYVYGDSEQARQPINVHVYDPYGKKVLQSYTVSDPIDGLVGSSFNVKASDFLPRQSDVPFIPEGVTTNNQATGQITSKGISMNPSTVDFYYKLPVTDENVSSVKPIHVIYIDNGQQVGSDQEVKPVSGTDYQGELISDVTKRSVSQHGTTWSTLQSRGYRVTPGSQLKNDPDLTDTGNQDLSATFNTSHSPYVTVNIEKHPNQDTGKLLVVQNLYNKNGSDLMSTQTNLEKIYNLEKTYRLKNIGPGIIGHKVQIHAHDYDNLVPGYRLVDPSTDSNETKPTISDTYTLNGLSDGVVVYDYRATNSTGHNSDDSNHAEPIFVQYYDPSSGKQIKYAGYTGRIDGDMGQTFDITQQPGTHIPYGYQLTSNVNLRRTISASRQVIKLPVQPISNNSKKFDVTKEFYDVSDHLINSDTKTESIYLSNSQTLTASDENSDAGDFVSDSHRNRPVSVTVTGTGANPEGWTFNYRTKAHGSNVAPITINYYNQHDQPVSLNNKITSGAMGATINVAKATDTNVSKAGYNVINNQKLDYSLSKTPQTVNLVVDGKKASNQMQIKIVKEDISGNPLPNPYVKTVSINGLVGDQYSLEASAFAPKDYIADGHHTTQVSGTIKNDGITGPSKMPVFYYIPQDSAAPIHIDCYNQSGTKLFSDISISGLYGDEMNAYDYIADHDASKLNGYEKPVNLNDYNYVYTNNEQYATVVVTGDLVKNTTYQVDRIKNTRVGQQNSDTFNGNLTARVGDIRTISPSDFIPNGYYVDSKDQPIQVTVNSVGQIIPSSPLKFTYDHQDVTGHIIYQDISDDDNQVGEEDVTGQPGSVIRYSNYKYFLPYGYKFNSYGIKMRFLRQNGTTVIYVNNLNDPTALTPKAQDHYGWINVQYVDHGNVIATKSITNKVGKSFNVHDYSSSDTVFSDNFMDTNNAPVGYKVDGSSNSVNQFKSTPQTLTVNVEPDSSRAADGKVTDYIIYKDADTGQVYSHRRFIIGDAGSKIDYQPYEEFLPSGYCYDGLGSHEDTLEGRTTNVILVRRATDAYQYGTIKINYYDVSKGGKRFLMSDEEAGRNGMSFKYDYEAFTPDGYTYNKIIDGSTHYFNSGTQTIDVGVVPESNSLLSTINIEYKDNDGNIIRQSDGQPISQQVMGKVGDFFDWIDYLDEVPNGYVYTDMPKNLPNEFGPNDSTVYIHVKKI